MQFVNLLEEVNRLGGIQPDLDGVDIHIMNFGVDEPNLNNEKLFVPADIES